jgi:two-component sensor histidine kinase/PAS domain-containing protein
MQRADAQDHAPSGLAATPVLRWGSHVGHLFDGADELHDVLAPYFKAGLENNERCLWVTGAPFGVADARRALRALVADFDERERRGQIEILDGSAFYDPSKPLPADELVEGLLEKEGEALAAGFSGLRTNGNCAWVGDREWSGFQRYETLVQEKVRGRRLICMCSYRPDGLRAEQMIDLVNRHDLVLSRQDDGGPSRSGLGQDAPELPALETWLDLDQGVIDALPIGFYCCDSDGEILRANRKAVELWGRPVREIEPLHRFCGSFRIETLDGQFIPANESPMARAVLFGESFDGMEARVENPDGKRWVARVSVEPLRDSEGRVVGAINCFQDVTHEYEMRVTLERQQRTFDLAMIASQMGTWRYTLADNVCVYDDNAQQLYGLTEARFLHDEQGVKAKFHPDDMELMWSRVTQALDPEGDGRYEVEYRVKQIDGAWRWLSAWGTVEFEGEGSDRKPVAISGASRDLSELKKAEQLRQLLAGELSHRLKNTLAAVQSIVTYTLRGASDLRSAQRTVSERIVSLARVHDLLTARSWSGADLADVVEQAMLPFSAAQLDISGPSADISPSHALAVSLALHELAINAVKYGALSTAEGRVEIGWTCGAERIRLVWRESGGPPVTPPTRRGFGSRLIEQTLGHDLGEKCVVDYAPQGVRCDLTIVL